MCDQAERRTLWLQWRELRIKEKPFKTIYRENVTKL